MDDGRENRFLLDTSIIVPIAIAGAVAVLIIAFVYCCRQFAFSKRLLSQSRHRDISGERNRPDMAYGHTTNPERGAVIHEQTTGGGLSSIFSTAMMGYLPRNGSRRNHYPPPSHHSRTNYNSTQVQNLVCFPDV